MRTKLLWALLLSVFLVVSVWTLNRKVSGTPDTMIALEPSVFAVEPNRTFNVNVTIADVVGLRAWEFRVSFDPSVLQAVSVTEGSFLMEAAQAAEADTVFDNRLNNTGGIVIAWDTILPLNAGDGATGSGTLATVTFNVTSEGKGVLHLYETKLIKLVDMTQMAIEHSTKDGLFQYPLLRDVAVTSVSVFPTSVQAGEHVSINVTVKNEGNVTETFSVSALYNDTNTIGTKPVTDLAPEGSLQLNFSWNTTDVAAGNYTITAKADRLQGETDAEDNTYSYDGVVRVTARPQPPSFPIEFIVLAVVIVVIVGIAGFFYVKSRKPAKS
jgi:hypothetical protein